MCKKEYSAHITDFRKQGVPPINNSYVRRAPPYCCFAARVRKRWRQRFARANGCVSRVSVISRQRTPAGVLNASWPVARAKFAPRILVQATTEWRGRWSFSCGMAVGESRRARAERAIEINCQRKTRRESRLTQKPHRRRSFCKLTTSRRVSVAQWSQSVRPERTESKQIFSGHRNV